MFLIKGFLRHSHKKTGNKRRTLVLRTKRLFWRDAWEAELGTKKGDMIDYEFFR